MPADSHDRPAGRHLDLCLVHQHAQGRQHVRPLGRQSGPASSCWIAAVDYAQIIVGSESKVFGAKTFCAFGTDTVDEAKKLLCHAHCVLLAAKLIGTAQNREIMLLTPDEFRYSNSVTALGANAEVLWKRVL